MEGVDCQISLKVHILNFKSATHDRYTATVERNSPLRIEVSWSFVALIDASRKIENRDRAQGGKLAFCG